MKTEEEKLAAMVDTLATVIIDERGLHLYVRTFVYNRAELSSMLKCINMVKNPNLRVMTKEVPHDFFLTHPVSEFVEGIRFPTIIEFDAAHEYNGQGIIASMFPAINSHSRLQYNDNSSYQRHVSGKWMENPVIHIGHDIDKEFHYWKDIVNHLAPSSYKRPANTQLARESQWVIQNGWLEPEELINREYLEYVLKEKKYGTRQAKEALELVKQAGPFVENKVLYDTLLHVFERTAMTTELYEASAKLFFGYRLLAKENGADKDYAGVVVEDGLQHTFDICMSMNEYPYKGPTGQFHWSFQCLLTIFFCFY